MQSGQASNTLLCARFFARLSLMLPTYLDLSVSRKSWVHSASRE
jgi:hypothetical protein